jgi:phosphatidylserine/phosphatidylglycerophosphate/cardiolipin synthase-like enzyme
VAIFDFTSGDLADALVRAKERGIALRVIADPKRGADKNSETPFLQKKGVNLRLLPGKGRGIMHNKFAIFDGKILLTGSYNWTENAEKYNWENVIIIEDTAVVRAYRDEFEKMWKAAGE